MLIGEYIFIVVLVAGVRHPLTPFKNIVGAKHEIYTATFDSHLLLDSVLQDQHRLTFLTHCSTTECN